MGAMVLLSPEELEALVARAVAPVLAEVERLRSSQSGELLTLPDAAVRLRRSLRTVERWAARGHLEVVHLGGARYVRLPAAPQQR